MWDCLFINARLATMASAGYGLIDDAAIAVKDGRIVWLGAMAALPAPAAELAAVVHDEAGRLLTPGLVDPHTHIVHAGERCSDYVLRTGGARRHALAAARRARP